MANKTMQQLYHDTLAGVISERTELQKRVRELEKALNWYQEQHTLHYNLELLYCVDHYELSKVDESERVIWTTSGESLLECIEAGFANDRH